MAVKKATTKTEVKEPKVSTVPKVATSRVKKIGLVAPKYTKAGVQAGDVVLPEAIFGQKVNEAIVAQAIRVYLSNQRQSNAHTKTRAEVDRTKKKVYRQKGTGGARHGSKNAPLFVGGGRTHGPKNFENYTLEMPKKMARVAFICALSDKAHGKKIVIADIEKIEPKTKRLAQFLKKCGFAGATVVHAESEALYRAGRNMEKGEIIRASELNTYDVVKSRILLITEEGLEMLTERVQKHV